MWHGRTNLSFTGPERQVYRNWHWKDVMTLVRSAHTFKWGYEGQYVNFDLIRGNGARSATFTGTRSGNSMADFMLGAFDNVSHGFGAADSFPLLWKHQFFIQDEWKLTPRITMNAGLRYEPWFPWEQEYGRYTSWEFGTQSTVKPDAPRGILFPGDPNVPFKTVENDLNNFAPRLGLAWDVNGNGRTVVRGGYGIYYNHISGTSVHAAEAPWTGTVQLLQRPHRRSVRIAQQHASALGRADFRRVRLRADQRISRAELPAVSAAAQLRLQRSRDGHAVRAPRQRVVPASADERLHGRCGVHRPVRVQARRAIVTSTRRSSSTRRAPALAPSTQNINERVLYEPGIIGPTSRVLETSYRELVQRPRVEGDQAHEPRVHVLRLLHALEGGGHAARSGRRADRGRGEPVRPRPTMKGRSQFDRRHVVGLSWMWEQIAEFDNRVVNALLERMDRQRRAQLVERQPAELRRWAPTSRSTERAAPAGSWRSLRSGKTVDDITRDHASREDFINAFFDTSAFAPVASLPRGIYGNVPKSAISGPADGEDRHRGGESLHACRDAKAMRLQFRGELFNAFNQVNFGRSRVTHRQRRPTSAASRSAGIPHESDRSR